MACLRLVSDVRDALIQLSGGHMSRSLLLLGNRGVYNAMLLTALAGCAGNFVTGSPSAFGSGFCSRQTADAREGLPSGRLNAAMLTWMVPQGAAVEASSRAALKLRYRTLHLTALVGDSTSPFKVEERGRCPVGRFDCVTHEMVDSCSISGSRLTYDTHVMVTTGGFGGRVYTVWGRASLGHGRFVWIDAFMTSLQSLSVVRWILSKSALPAAQ